MGHYKKRSEDIARRNLSIATTLEWSFFSDHFEKEFFSKFYEMDYHQMSLMDHFLSKDKNFASQRMGESDPKIKDVEIINYLGEAHHIIPRVVPGISESGVENEEILFKREQENFSDYLLNYMLDRGFVIKKMQSSLFQTPFKYGGYDYVQKATLFHTIGHIPGLETGPGGRDGYFLDLFIAYMFLSKEYVESTKKTYPGNNAGYRLYVNPKICAEPLFFR